MTTPIGCLRVLTQTLMRLARNGDVDGFSAYVRSDAFLTAFNGLNPGRRQSALRCYGRAEALCEARARHPLAKPAAIDAKRTQKVNWGDPAMRAKLAAAYATAGGNDEKAARFLGVSLGSARLAKRRHLNGAPSGQCQQAAISGQARPSTVDGPGYGQFANGQRHGLRAAFRGGRKMIVDSCPDLWSSDGKHRAHTKGRPREYSA